MCVSVAVGLAAISVCSMTVAMHDGEVVVGLCLTAECKTSDRISPRTVVFIMTATAVLRSTQPFTFRETVKSV